MRKMVMAKDIEQMTEEELEAEALGLETDETETVETPGEGDDKGKTTPAESGETDEETQKVSTSEKQPEDEPDPEKKPAEEDDGEKRRKGVLRELQKERRRRQELEAELETVRRQTPPAKPDKENPNPDAVVEDDEGGLITEKRLKAILDEQESRREEREHKKSEEARMAVVLESERKVKDEYSIENAPEGYDYDSVVETGKDYLSPMDVRKTLASENPALMLYKLCIIRCPELRKYAPQEVLPKRTPDQTPPNGKPKVEVQPGRTPRRGGAGASPAAVDYDKMSVDELEQALNELQQ
jgi:hypothetical protein